MKQIIGQIEGHDVIYVPEKDVVFCKNTTLPFSVIKEVQKMSSDSLSIPEKNLTIHKYESTIEMGCLTTSKSHFNELIKTINKIKRL